jgi:rfaE bifunctional protein kinase chain/domain
MSAAAAAEEARRILARLKGRRILVVGDVMLDEFVWGRVSRISPEAPVPVVEVTRETQSVGGAGNVANNVQALGGQALLVGYVGDDQAGDEVRQALAANGVVSRLVSSPHRATTRKTRIIAHQQQLVRADRDPVGALPAGIDQKLAAACLAELGSCRAVIVSDYAKGLVSRALMRRIVAAARRRGIPVLVDPKVRPAADYLGATIVTPNQAEAEQTAGVHITDDASLAEAGRRLLARWRAQAVLVTRGERGMSLFAARQKPHHVATAAREVFDVTGAGDTVIAALGLAVGAGVTLRRAAAIANLAAGVVVSKVGTATASPAEVEAAARLAARR